MANLPGGVTIKSMVPFQLYKRLALGGLGVVRETITANVTILGSHEEYLVLNPSTGNWDVTLPVIATAQAPNGARRGNFHVVSNSGSTYNLVVKTAAPATLATLNPGEFGMFIFDTDWRVVFTTPSVADIEGNANDFTANNTFAADLRLLDAATLSFGTAGGDIVITADGTDIVITGTGDVVIGDGVGFAIGTGKDVAFTSDGTNVAVSGAGKLRRADSFVDSWGAGDDLQVSSDGANASVVAPNGNLIIDNQSVTGAIYMDLGTTTSATEFGVRDNAGSRLFHVTAAGKATVTGDLKVTGKLVATGGSVMVDAEHVDLRSNYEFLNVDYTTAAGQTGGLVINYLPVASYLTTGAGVVVAGVVGVSNPTITTFDANGLVITDLVMISGSANDGENDGLYEVFSHAANLLTLKSTAAGLTAQVEAFTQGTITANSGDVGMTITKVTVTVLRAGSADGIWEVGSGSVTGIVFSDLLRASDIGSLVPALAVTDAIGAENTDGLMSIPLLGGVGDAGTWTKAITSGGLATVTRTAAAGGSSFWVDVPVPARTSALKGIKPTGLRINYTAATAVVGDVRFELWKVTQGADGAARTAAVIVGNLDADYDAAHDTAAERADITGAPELHLAIVTDAAGAVYLGAGESLKLRCFVEGDGAGLGTIVITDANLLYSETTVDLA